MEISGLAADRGEKEKGVASVLDGLGLSASDVSSSGVVKLPSRIIE